MVRNILRDGEILSTSDVLTSPDREFEALISHDLRGKEFGFLKVVQKEDETSGINKVIWAEGKKVHKSIPKDSHLYCLYQKGTLQIRCTNEVGWLNSANALSSRTPSPVETNNPLYSSYINILSELNKASFLVSETLLYNFSTRVDYLTWIEVKDDGALCVCYKNGDGEVIILWSSINPITKKKREKRQLRSKEVLFPGEYLVTDTSHHFLSLAKDDLESNQPVLRVYEGFPPDNPFRTLWTGKPSGWRNERSEHKYLFLVNDSGALDVYGTDNEKLLNDFASLKYDPESKTYIDKLHNELLSPQNSDLLTRTLIDVNHPVSEMSHKYVLQDDGNFVLLVKKENEVHHTPVWSTLVNLNKPVAPEIKDKEETWLKEVDYENMEIGESRMLLVVGGHKYVLLDESPEDKTNTTDIMNASCGIKITKNFLGPSFAIVAKGSIIDVVINNAPSDLAALDISIFSLEAQATIGTYIGAGAEIVAIEGNVSLFKLKLALGVETGIGIKDDSVTIKLLGTGFQIGRVWSVSAVGSSVGIDFGRLYNTVKGIFD